MRRFRPILLLVTLLTSTTATLAAQRAIPSGTIGAGVLSFDGRATVGDFTGTTSTVTGEMTGGTDLSAVRGWVEAPVKTLETGNDKRDKDLNKSMEFGKYPVIRFELTGVVPAASRGDTVDVILLGTFLIHGVSRADSIPATVVLLPQGVKVQGKAPLDLGDYKIGGLSKAMGMLKMSEDILVRLDLTFAATPMLGTTMSP